MWAPTNNADTNFRDNFEPELNEYEQQANRKKIRAMMRRKHFFLQQDLPAAVQRVAKFLNKEFTSEQTAKLCDHLSINNFKNNKSVHLSSDNRKKLGFPSFDTFIRKSKAGGWRDYFDEEMSAEAEQWIASNLKNTDLRFPHIQ